MALPCTEEKVQIREHLVLMGPLPAASDRVTVTGAAEYCRGQEEQSSRSERYLQLAHLTQQEEADRFHAVGCSSSSSWPGTRYYKILPRDRASLTPLGHHPSSFACVAF